jgi:hypothetical protein
MATIVLSAAGAALGGTFGGTFAGLSSVAIGRAAGAALGRALDQDLLGAGSEAVEVGRVDRFRLTGAGEGDPIKRIFGRMRVAGHVIWASDFAESAVTSGGGKGSRGPSRTDYSYSVSLAVALCEGEITHVGRVWADGEEVPRDDLNMRIYRGSRDQLPDPVMEAIEGAGQVPAYRGTAYVVLEDLPLAPYGNRVPQFSFEVTRPEQPEAPGAEDAPSFGVRGVALIPGTGEYALATTPVSYRVGEARRSANISTPAAKPDFAVALDNLTGELPNLEAASLVVSWFGDDLRCGACRIKPKVEDRGLEGEEMPWQVSGLGRAAAEEIPREAGRSIYGGTPTDASVIEAIAALKAAGRAVMLYPFILMDQLAGNGLPDPYSDAPDQPPLPWRGRITLSQAPGRAGSPDRTPAAEAEVAAFFGTVTAADFAVGDGVVSYQGPEEWSFSRFILHQAALCAAAGGVAAFCVGSEMRGLTQIRGAGDAFVAVSRLRALAAEARALLGPDCKISYAADWSEYFGYAPQDGSGDRYFHLDPFWADPEVDFIGIDNYMPLSDWRDGEDHLDAQEWAAIYDEDYLQANIEGGEGYDWYYHSPEARAAQIRTPITDAAESEPWVHRYKDVRNWWRNLHHERRDGVRQAAPTPWVPQSKPIWFTEYGCAAVDKGTNQPNKFLDAKSSESSLPYHSNGARDGLIQMAYLRAISSYWSDPARNPLSEEYEGRMIDLERAFVWTWDTRPYPFFPRLQEKWSDGENYARGHWINGRTSGRRLASVVREICTAAGLRHFSTEGLHGFVRGYGVEQVGAARAALQPLMLRHDVEAVERGGVLHFRNRGGGRVAALAPGELALSEELEGGLEQVREAEAALSGRVRLRFLQAEADFKVISEEAILPDEATQAVSASELNMVLTRGEGRHLAEQWLIRARLARERLRLALPPSAWHLGAGDLVRLPGAGAAGEGCYRIDRVEQGPVRLVEAVRVAPETPPPPGAEQAAPRPRAFLAPLPVDLQFLDLPLLRGDEVPHAPHMAPWAEPWPGAVAVHASMRDADYRLAATLTRRATMGSLVAPLAAARPGLVQQGPGLRVTLRAGALQSIPAESLLAGGNLAAIGDGTAGHWEVIQFGRAELVAPDTWLLSDLLRGQAGSDALMPESWPAGSAFVLLEGAVRQLEMAPAQRRLAQHFRYGPAGRPLEDGSYRHRIEHFAGVGLRPLSPCHLRLEAQAGGDLALSWVRRTRIDGDSWEASEVPLGEEREAYVVEVRADGAVRRRVEVGTPAWTYGAAARAADGLAGAPFELAVAQLSALYGPGPARTLRHP